MRYLYEYWAYLSPSVSWAEKGHEEQLPNLRKLRKMLPLPSMPLLARLAL